MNRLAPLAAIALSAAALVGAGCGGSSGDGGAAAQKVDPNGPEVSPPGDIPDNQAFVAYTPAGAGFSVKVPEGWARTTAAGATTFTDKLNSVTIARPAAAARAPTAASATATEIPRLAETVEGFAAGHASTVARTAGRAVGEVRDPDRAPSSRSPAPRAPTTSIPGGSSPTPSGGRDERRPARSRAPVSLLPRGRRRDARPAGRLARGRRR